MEFGRAGEERIDIPIDEVLHWRSAFNPPDVVGGIEPDIAGYEAQEYVRVVVQGPNTHALALETHNAVDAVICPQLEAPEVDASQHLDRCTGLDRPDVHRWHIEIEIGHPARKPIRIVDAGVTFDVADIAESIGAHQFPGKVEGCPAIRTTDPPPQPDGGRFQRRLRCRVR